VKVNDTDKSKEDLITELEKLRQRNAELERSETELKQAAEALHKSEKRFRSLVDTAVSVILCLSPDYRITEFNPEAERLYGYKREEVLGKDYLKLFIPEAERDAISADIKKVLSGEPTKGFENPVLSQDGTERILAWNVNRMLDSQNRPIGIIAVGQDITERKKMEEVLRLKQFAIDHSSDAAFWMGSDARFFYVNDAACRALGYTREELLTMTVHDIDPDFPREIWPQHWAAVKHKGSFVVESHHCTKDGRIFPVEISVNYLEFGGKEYSCAFARDITERKQAEERIEKLGYLKEALLSTDSLDERLKVITDGIVEIFEADFARIWIRREGDLCDSGCFHATLTEGPHVCRNRDRCLHLTASSGRYTHLDGSHGRVPFGCYKIGRVAAGEDAKFLTNDVTNDPRVHDHDWAAELGLVSFGGYRLLAADGTPIGVLAFFSKQVVSRDEDALLEDLANTTAQVIQTGMVEEALKASQAKYQDLYDNAPDMFASVDAKTGKIVECNQTALKALGYRKEEIVGCNIAELYHPDCEEVRKKVFKTFVETGEVHEAELKLQRKDGSVIDVSLNVSAVRDEQGNILYSRSIWRDITDRKRLEAQLHEAKTMESIATLAGGIAHEFNNALYGITGNIELLKMDLPSTEEVSRYLKPMSESARRMVRLTDQLLAYAQGGKYRSQTISLNNFVDDTLPLIQHWIKPNIRVETDLPGNISNIEADLTQMQMVLSAVVANAAEAIEGRGRIRIITRNEKIDEASANQHLELKAGRYVCLTVRDDGKGMPDEISGRIFKPFFTTKFQGRGLGMAAVFGIVKNHGGWIGVDSQLGEGTMVHIYLPAVDDRITEAKKPVPTLVMGTGTVLIIEDEDDVMEVSRTILKKLGYQVIEAKTGTEAVNLVRNLDVDIDLAILDIGLPDLAGDEVFKLIKEARPDLKVVVCSGYAIDGPAQEMLDAGAQGFIQKPYAFKALSAKLKEVLDSG